MSYPLKLPESENGVTAWQFDFPRQWWTPLECKEGDQIEIQVAAKNVFAIAKAPGAHELLARLRKLRGRLPARMSGTESFFDTSVLLYPLSEDTVKAEGIETLLASRGVISVQVLNEFAVVALQKLKMPPVPSAFDVSDRTRSCRSVGLLEGLQLQVESGHSMLFEIRKPECVL